MYPHWNARDNYRYGLKKKKRKRDKSDDPGKPFQTFSTAYLMFSFLRFFPNLKWHSLSRDEQSKYYELAQTERQKHMKMYPGWSARDNYAKHKKKRRKRDKLKDGGRRPVLSCPQCHVHVGGCSCLSKSPPPPFLALLNTRPQPHCCCLSIWSRVQISIGRQLLQQTFFTWCNIIKKKRKES